MSVKASATVGVGQDCNSVATVRSTNGGSRYTMPFRIIPERGKVCKDNIESSISECCHVLSEHDTGSKNPNRSQVMLPEARTTPRDTNSLSSIADVLTGESPCEHVDRRNCCKIERRNVVINLGVGPVLSEDCLGVWVALDEPGSLEAPRSFKLMPEEYSRDLYPENGRVADFLFFAIGLSSVAFFLPGSNAGKIVSFLKTPGVTALFLILMVSIPLIVALGFVKRFFTRIDKHESVAIFLVHALLDLAHTLFYVSLLIMSIPALGFLLMGK